MKCDRCGYENPDYLEYCQNCTAPLNRENADDGKEPSWGFVNAPKWDKPDFSADTVSDDDIPADFINGRRAASAAAGAAVGAAASTLHKAGKKTARQYDDDFDLDREIDEFDDEIDDLDDDIRRTGRKQSAVYVDRAKKRRRDERYYNDDVDEEENVDEDEYYDDDFDGNGREGGTGGRSLRPLIRIVGVIAALAVLAAAIWLIAKSAKGCAGKQREFDPPVVEQGEEGSNCYYVTVHAAEGTKLVYETTDGGRTPYTVPESCIAKFKVPVSGLMPGEPIDGAVYYAKPRVLVVNEEEGTEEPIKIDDIAIPVPSLGLTFDNEDNIVTDDGKAVISGHIDYVNAVLTMLGEQVEIAGDGTFRKEFTYNEVGDHKIDIEAKLPNYQIAKHTVNVTVNAPVVEDPDAVIRMPWEYGDNTFSQRVINSVSSIDVRGKVPEGSTVTVSSESSNATLTTPTVDDDGTFHFTLTMANPGDYTVTVTCTTPQGATYDRDIHLQRQPDYRNYISGAAPADFSAFSYGYSQAYKISGVVREIVQEGDYYLARFEMNDGHTIMLEYHNHYGSAGPIEVGRNYSEIYGRSKGFDDNGNILFYVWFIND